jgi:hypothetical protein
MDQTGEKDEQHQRLDEIKDHIDQARVAADHLADDGVIETKDRKPGEPQD